MVFSSHIFVFYFLPLTLAVYFLVPTRGKNLILALLSYVFYGWANPAFVFLMFGATVINYVCGFFIARQMGIKGARELELLSSDAPRNRAQKAAVAVAVVSNLAVLGFFKYFNFGVDNYNALMEAVGLGHLSWDTFFRVTLPLGISFYTFQSISYSIDVYRGQARAIRNFVDFACFVAMFPQLVAGPIIRFREVATRLIYRSVSVDKFARGISFVMLGLAKKILLANSCGKIADTCFDAGSVGVSDAWYGAVAYAFQIYFDFSGYSDIAIGLGLMFGFVFPKNFDSPYLAESITEFWQKWHLSLSTWLRDYLYIPLGGNRKGQRRTYVNLALVMLLGGLWHGASWNFVIWGGIHGAALALERMRGKHSVYHRLFRPVRIALTFFIALIAWVFFRATTLERALSYLQNMFGLGPSHAADGLVGGLVYQPLYLGFFIIAGLAVWLFPQTWDFTRRLTWAKATFATAVMLLALLGMSTQAYNPFIYFIF